MPLNHNVADMQPISEIISDVDIAFKIGITLGFVMGIILGVFLYALYRDYKEDKLGVKWK